MSDQPDMFNLIVAAFCDVPPKFRLELKTILGMRRKRLNRRPETIARMAAESAERHEQHAKNLRAIERAALAEIAKGTSR